MAIPNRFIKHIEDERIKRLIKETWDRIPWHEQAIIARQLTGIWDQQLERPEVARTYSREIVTVDEVEIGSPLAAICLDVDFFQNKDDAIVVKFIAHEFAHVFLGHHVWGRAVNIHETLNPLTAAAIHWVNEWSADLVIWQWRFREELRAAGSPSGAPPPPWHLVLVKGGE